MQGDVMGSFFLTNDTSEEKINKVLDLYKKKGMHNYTKLISNDCVLLYFPKINLQYQQIYKHKENYIVGIGTFFYKDKYGADALEEIYSAYSSGENVFAQTRGHFNFVLFIGGELQVVTDKTGLLHSHIARERNCIYISNSFLAIGEALDNLTVSSQALMEFAVTQAVYGGATFFQEINHLESGMIYQVNEELKRRRYFSPSYKKDYSVEDVFNDIGNYFEIFKKNDVDLKITADLSGGYDTRLVNAILRYKKIKYTPNVNTNVTDESDVRIAREIAEGESQELAEYQKQIEKYDYRSLIKEAFFSLEASRDLFGAAYSPVYFQQKSKDFQVIIGGYGGELYRDKKYFGMNSVNTLVESQYGCSPLIFRNYKEYKNNLSKKLKSQFELGERTTKRDIERIYYFNRMRYWGGSRLTYFNQYAYRIHPLLDFELASFLFDIPAKEKRNAKLQKVLTDRFDHKLAGYASQYGYNLAYKSNLKSRAKDLYSALLHKLIMALAIVPPPILGLALGVYRRLRERAGARVYKRFYLENEFVRTVLGTEDLMVTEYLQLNPEYIDLRPLVTGRIYTIELVLRYFRNKLSR